MWFFVTSNTVSFNKWLISSLSSNPLLQISDIFSNSIKYCSTTYHVRHPCNCELKTFFPSQIYGNGEWGRLKGILGSRHKFPTI